jgi:hypothetical protein
VSIQRWHLGLTDGIMRPRDDGAFVYYSDYEALQSRVAELERAATTLADCWAHYRKCHDEVGGGDPMTGRAWMLTTRAETKVRELLKEPK